MFAPDGQYTEDSPRLNELYELAQEGQMYMSALDELSEEELIFLAGHEPMSYFDLDEIEDAARRERQLRRSKLIHNSIRARFVLERRWTDHREQANRDLLERSIDVADKSRRLSLALVLTTIGLVLATVALTIATFRL
jgi:hypothetical protein